MNSINKWLSRPTVKLAEKHLSLENNKPKRKSSPVNSMAEDKKVFQSWEFEGQQCSFRARRAREWELVILLDHVLKKHMSSLGLK